MQLLNLYLVICVKLCHIWGMNLEFYGLVKNSSCVLLTRMRSEGGHPKNIITWTVDDLTTSKQEV